MKRGIGILGAIFLIASVSAISSDLKDNYEKGETIIGEISGNIIQAIKPEQVELKRGHVLVPFEYDIKKLGDKYFLWGIAPQNENNYSLVVNNIATIVNGRTEEVDFVHNFSVGGNLTDYNIKPGFILAKEDFGLITELNLDFEKTIDIDLPVSRSINLKPGKNEIKFSVGNFNETGFVKINVGKYSVPAYIIVEKKNNSFVESEKPKLRTEPNAIVSTIYAGDKAVYPFQIINFGDKKIEGLMFEYNKELFSIDKEIVSIEANSAIEINLSFNGKVNEEQKKNGIKEFFYLNINEERFELPIVISFTENKTDVKTPYLQGEKAYYCPELNGTQCLTGEEICDGNLKTSIDGPCCIGNCVTQKSEGSKSWIGYIIAFIIIIILIYVFIRYKKTKNTGDGFNKRLAIAEGKMNKLP